MKRKYVSNIFRKLYLRRISSKSMVTLQCVSVKFSLFPNLSSKSFGKSWLRASAGRRLSDLARRNLFGQLDSSQGHADWIFVEEISLPYPNSCFRSRETRLWDYLASKLPNLLMDYLPRSLMLEHVTYSWEKCLSFSLWAGPRCSQDACQWCFFLFLFVQFEWLG